MEFGALARLGLIRAEPMLALSLIHILKMALKEEDYRTVLFMGKDNHNASLQIDAVLKEFQTVSDIPVVLVQGAAEEGSSFSLNQYNRRLLVIVNLMQSSNVDFEDDRQLLRRLWPLLGRNTRVRLILLVREPEDEAYVPSLLRLCAQNKYANVVAFVVPSTLAETPCVYTFKLYPRAEVTRARLRPNQTQFFPPPAHNMHGSQLRIIVDQVAPKSYIYYRKPGAVTLSGYVGKLFAAFARKHNATLAYPLLRELGAPLYNDVMDAMMANGTFDMSTGLTFDHRPSDLIRTNSYDSMDWCIMVPVEKPVPSYFLYVIIFDRSTLAVTAVALVAISCLLACAAALHGRPVYPGEYVFNVHAFNALLGQAHKTHAPMRGMRRAVYLLVSFAGILFNTTYSSYLQSLEAHAPREAPVRSLGQLARSGKRLAIYHGEVATMCRMIPDCEQYQSLLYVVGNYSDFFALRDSFDTRFAFPVPSAKWTSYEMQQKFFSKPVFRLSSICIVEDASNLFSLPVNSVHLEPLNRLIGQLQQAGLVQHWKMLSFLELVRLGRVRIVDLTPRVEFVPLKLADLYIVLLLFAGAISGTICVFLTELSMGRCRRFWEVVKGRFRG